MAWIHRAAELFRDFLNPLAPIKGTEWEPDKGDLRVWGGQIEDKIDALNPDAIAAAVAAAQAAAAVAQASLSAPGLVYDTYAAPGGLAGNLSPAANTQGQVLLDGGYTGFYLKSGASGSGSWVYKSPATIPSLEAGARRRVAKLTGNTTLELRTSYQTPGFLEAWVGDGGRVYGGIADDWQLTWGRANIRRNGNTDFWTPPGVAFQIVRPADYSVLLRLLDDGTLETEVPLASGGSVAAASIPVRIRARLLTTVWHGQSLSYGVNASAISLSGVPGLLMFNGGRRPHEAGGAPYASTVPWVESNATDPIAAAPYGETPVSGYGQYLAQLAAAQSGLTMGTDFSVLAVSTGQGSTAIDDLDSDSAYWPRLTSAVPAALTNAAALGEATYAPSLMWEQGERDIAIGTTKATYKTKLVSLQADYETLARTNFGGTYVVPLITAQTMSRLGYSAPSEEISQAQNEAARENPGKIILSTSNYIFDYVDTAHLTSASYKIKGAYYSLAQWVTVMLEQPWKPLDIDTSSISRQGKVLTFRLINGNGPIVVDTTLVSSVANSGFWVGSPAGATNTISAIRIDRSGNVQITCASAISAGDILTYARNATGTGTNAGRTLGPRGNIRDSSRLIYPNFDPTGINWPMDKWLVSFKETIS